MFATGPKLRGSWQVVEAFCNDGFSFFSCTPQFERAIVCVWKLTCPRAGDNTPITRYCIKRRPAPAANVPQPGWQIPGYAPYVSCNAPEAGSLNTHANPVCICACYADRLIAMQPKKALEKSCGAQKNPAHPTYHNCNCTSTGGVQEPNASLSRRFVGAMQVRCPYFFYSQPVTNYGWETPCGKWLSFPREGACQHGSSDGHGSLLQDANECTWYRSSMALNIYGSQLLDLGWNRSSSFEDKSGARKNDTEQTLNNSRVLKAAFQSLASLFRPRCCGC